MTPEASPVPEGRRTDETEADPSQQQQPEEELRGDGNCPTRHPSAPPDEKLLPLDGGQGDDLQGLATWNDSSQRSQADKMEDTASSPILSNSDGNIEAMETQQDLERSPSSAGTDGEASLGNHKMSAREEDWYKILFLKTFRQILQLLILSVLKRLALEFLATSPAMKLL